MTRVWFNVAERRERETRRRRNIDCWNSNRSHCKYTLHWLLIDFLRLSCFMRVTPASNPLLKTTFHLQTLSLLSNHFPPSDEVWLNLFIDMKRSGSGNNLVGKGQNLSQEFWPTVKIKFLVAWAVSVSHTSGPGQHFYSTWICSQSPPSAYLYWYEEGCERQSIVWLI